MLKILAGIIIGIVISDWLEGQVPQIRQYKIAPSKPLQPWNGGIGKPSVGVVLPSSSPEQPKS